jgi:hypothetical protein
MTLSSIEDAGSLGRGEAFDALVMLGKQLDCKFNEAGQATRYASQGITK